MDAVYLHNKYVAPLGYDGWHRAATIGGLAVRQLAARRTKESGKCAAARGTFVYSKFMSWVALDRSLRLADKRSFPADRARWLKVRDEIYEEVMSQGWSADRKAFVQSYGSDALDASMLLMPLVFFMAPNDPRMLSTIDAIRRSVAAGGLAADGLVYRYDPECRPRRSGGPRRNVQHVLVLARRSLTPRATPIHSGWKMRDSCSSRCSATPITWAFTPSKPAPAAKRWAIFRRRSRTWP